MAEKCVQLRTNLISNYKNICVDGTHKACSFKFSFKIFYSTLFYSILFYSILFSDSICNSYFALVSPTWDPNGPILHNAVESLNFKCFSSWHFPIDITSKIVSSTSTIAGSGPFFAVNGYYASENYNLLHAELVVNPWAEFEFDAIVTITKIIVKARYSTVFPHTAFDLVRVELGNATNNNGNFGSFTTLGTYEKSSANGAIIVYTVTPPKSGKYLAFRCYDNLTRFLLIADLKVLGY